MALEKLQVFVFLAIFALCKSDVDTSLYLTPTEVVHYENLAVRAVGEALQCEGLVGEQFQDFLNEKDINLEEISDWAVPMFDSWGKIPSGIFTGNVIDYGQFDECISIGHEKLNAADIKGKYCAYAVSGIIYNLTLTWAICIPEACEISETFIPVAQNITFRVAGDRCQTNGSFNKLEWDDGLALGIFGFILVIILFSTIYDGLLHYRDQKTSNPLFIAFSLVTNSKKLFSVSNAPGQVGCLHGIRAVSLMWIIAGHRFVSASALPSINLVQAIEFKNDIASSYISSARAAVDTFFMFSAFLVSFIYFKGVRSAIAKAEAKGSSHVENPLTLAKIPMYYVHRILRITPALAATFFIQITLFRRIGEGPLWPLIIDMSVSVCTEWWWSLFLYVQNYVNYKEMCIVPTWYLSADMQLYLLSPFLIIPLGNLVIKGKKKLAYILMCIVIAISIIVPMTIEFFREFDPLNIYETHHRASVYTIGILFGMIMIDCTDKKIKINPFLSLILWGVSLGVMLAIVITMHDTEVNPELEKNNLYFSLTRPVWSAALCWIVFACQFGYGGPVNWFLSKSIFQIMTKLSFSMYLLHNLVITLSIGTGKISGHFSEYETIYKWCGDYIFTIVISIIWVLCFESPVVGIEKVIFGTGKRPARPAAAQPEVKIEEGVPSTSKSV